MNTKEEQIQSVKNEIINLQKNLSKKEKKEFESNKCILYDGPLDAKTVVIARDLGKEELKQNVPLIGQAGILFRFVEASLNVSSFLTNTVPYKPVNNEAFSKNIRIQFLPYIKKIITIINPESIILLGNEALSSMTDNCSGILSWAQEDSIFWQIGKKSYNTFPTAHPSYLIRNGITINSLKINLQHKKIFKELFFRNIYKAHQYAGNVK